MKFSSKQYALALNEILKNSPPGKRDGFLINFVKLLKSKKDLKKIRFVEEEMNKMFFSERQEIEAEITSAYDLSGNSLRDIKRAIGDFLNKDVEKIILKQKIDEKIIGGFKAKFGDYLLDASVRNYLLKLKRNMLLN